MSSSDNRIVQRTTILLAVHDLASVLTLRLFVTGQGLQCLGRHLQEMKVTVDPGSKSTFSMVRDRTADMVSHTMMLNGVSLFLYGILATTFLSCHWLPGWLIVWLPTRGMPPPQWVFQ